MIRYLKSTWICPTVHPLLQLLWRLGQPEDSLEFKMGSAAERTIDLFFMYPGPRNNETWTGYQCFDEAHSKWVNFYPRIRHVCTADLHGFLVFVPCDTLSVIRQPYGHSGWMKPKGEETFNYEYNGTWSQEQWDRGEAFVDYSDS